MWISFLQAYISTMEKLIQHQRRVTFLPSMCELVVQLLEVSIPVLEREDIVGTHHVSSCVIVIVIPAWRGYVELKWKTHLDHRITVCKMQGKAIRRESSCRKMVTTVSSSLKRVGDLILLLSLITSLLVRIQKKWVTNTITKTIGALPPARWRKGTVRLIGLWRFNSLSYQNHRSISL